MGIEWFRDLVISVFGLVATGVLIFSAVLVYLIYRKIKPILESIKATSASVQVISSYVSDEVAKPMVQMAAIVQGVRQGIDAVSKLFKKERR